MPHIGEEQAALSAAPLAQTIVPGASPYTFTAVDRGAAIIQGGTVTLLELGRGGVFVTTGLTVGVLPMARGDQMRVTYAVIPTFNYFRS